MTRRKACYRVTPTGGIYPGSSAWNLTIARSRARRLANRYGTRFDICEVQPPAFRWKFIERVSPAN